MTRIRLVLLSSLALLALGATSSRAAPRAAPRSQSLVFDAALTDVRTAGPGDAHAGHRQIASGVLRSAAGRRVGRFTFTCTWVKIEADGALERCLASAWTADGRLDAAGPARQASSTHAWRVTGGTGAYRDATGSVTVRDLSDRESLISVALLTRDGAVLEAGRVGRVAANRTFIARADALCGSAARSLASLPPFPFPNFDPLQPDPATLPAVGAFFTGPGDPRPILASLGAGLGGLGEPPAEQSAWHAVLAARDRVLAVIDEQDQAALAGDVPGFVRSVHDSVAGFRAVAITATVFGVSRCVL
jgi:hypothetical protein